MKNQSTFAINNLDRRTFIKRSAAMLALPMLPTFVLLEGCGADDIIAGLQVADNTTKAVDSILAPVDPEIAAVVMLVSSGVETIISTYKSYEAALPAGKPSIGQVLEATVSGIQANLKSILSGVGVKNPALLTEITVGVAVVNTALIALLSKVTGTAGTAIRAAVIGQGLPVVNGAKSASDLKNAWNNAVKRGFPKAKI